MAKKIVIKVLAKKKLVPELKWDSVAGTVAEYGDTEGRLRKRLKVVLGKKEVGTAVEKGAKLKIFADPDKQVIGYGFFVPTGVSSTVLDKAKSKVKLKAFLPCKGTETDVDVNDDDLDEDIPDGADDEADGEEGEGTTQQGKGTTTQQPQPQTQQQPQPQTQQQPQPQPQQQTQPGTGPQRPKEATPQLTPEILARRWENRWAGLSQVMLKVLKAKPANETEIQKKDRESKKVEIQKTASESMKASKDGSHGPALASLDRLEQLMKTALISTAGNNPVQPEDDDLQEAVEEVQERLQKFNDTDYPKVATLDAGQLRDQRKKVEDLQTDGKYEQAAAEMSKLEKMTAQVARLTKDDFDVSKFKVGGNAIASGSYGAIYRVDTGDPTKKLVLKTAFTGGEQELKTEAESYALLGDHPNIVKCYGLVNIENQSGMLMEDLDGGKLDDAFSVLKSQREDDALSEPEYWAGLQNMFQGLLGGLAHMEQCGFVHNDIKGDNVMIDSKTGEAKLIDVGLITRIGAPQSKSGAAAFRAPEKPNQGINPVPSTASQDSYSAGQMLHAQEEGSWFKGVPDPTPLKPEPLRFDDQGQLEPNQPATKPGKYAEGFNSAYADFLNKLMHRDPTQRLAPSQALQHPFLAEGLSNVDDPVGEEGTIQKVMAGVLAGAEETQLKALRKKMEDADEDDYGYNTDKKKLELLEAKFIASQEEADKELQALEKQIAQGAEAMVRKDKAWKADAKTADKAHADALKVVGPVEKALIKGTVNQANATQMSKLVEGPLTQLNVLEARLAEHREELTEATRKFGDQIRQRDMLKHREAYNEAYRKANEGRPNDQKPIYPTVKPVEQADSDHKTLEKLAKWSRQATEAHATVTQTITTLKELRSEVAEVAKGGKQTPSATTDLKVVKKAVEAMAKAFPDWDSIIQEAQGEHDQTTRLVQGAQHRAQNNPVTTQEVAELKKHAKALEEKAAKIPVVIDEAEKRLNSFETLVGTRTKKGKGKRSAAAALDQEAQNTLIQATGFVRQLRGTGRVYQENLRALEELLEKSEGVV